MAATSDLPPLDGYGSKRNQLADAHHIGRLSPGPIRTIKLDWLQPRDGNIVELLFRPRAFQVPPEEPAAV